MNQTDRRRRGVKTGRSLLRQPPHRWMLVLVVASVVWRLIRYGLGNPMWGDEAFIAVNFITRTLGEMAGDLDHPQIVPVGFMMAQWLVSRVLGTGEYALRLLPVLVGVASVLVFWRLAPKMLGRRQAMAAVLIFAASYYPVRHSVEVKSYSLDLLVALILLGQAWGLCQSPKSVARWVVFFLSGAVSVWFSYPAVFIIGGSMFVLGYLLYERRSGVRWYAAWAVGGAVMAGSFLVMWRMVAVGQEVHHEGIHELKGWASAFPPMDSITGLVAWFFRSHTGNMFAYPVGGNTGGSTATFLLVIFGIIALWRTGKRRLLLLLLSPLPLMFVAAALKKYPYGDSARVLQHVVPMVCMLAGVGLVAFLHHGWKKRGVVSGMQITGVVMLCIIGYGVIRDIREPYKKESDLMSLQTVKAWAAQAGPNDQWVVFGTLGGTEQTPDFLPWGGSLARFRYDMLQHGPEGVDIRWGLPAEEVPAAGAGATTWLFIYHDNDQVQNPFPQAQADRYLEAVRQRLGEPKHEVVHLKEDSEEVEVYRFGPAD